MGSGIFRAGSIASFIVDEGRYLLGTYVQEQLKYVEAGQPVEIALDLHPGQIFEGKVERIWWASGEGQFLPSGTLPTLVEARAAAGSSRCPSETLARQVTWCRGWAATATDGGTARPK